MKELTEELIFALIVGGLFWGIAVEVFLNEYF
jgi:hypothetical protein